MGQMLVFTNAVEGRDDEFNDWYDTIHLKEVLEVPEFTAAQRYRLGDGQLFPDQPHRYLAIYEYAGTSAEAVAALGAAAPGFNMTDSMASDTNVILYE